MKTHHRYFISHLSALLYSLVLWWFVPSVVAETVNRIVAVVNDDIITEADVTAFLAALHDEPAPPGANDPQDPDMPRLALQRLIDRHLILQEAKRLGVTVETDEVLERYDAFRNKFPSDELFHQSLAQTGLSEEQLKQRVREQLMLQRVIDTKVRSMITVSPMEVSKELGAHPEAEKPGDRMRVSHLLVRVNEHRPEEEARKLIENLHAQLAQGADFSATAKRYSEDQHRDEGGDMGWVAPGELMPELDAALSALKVGELSGPIQSRLGFHLVRGEERKPTSDLSVMEAHHAVSQQIYQKKFQKAFARWVGELRRKAYIEIPGAPAS